MDTITLAQRLDKYLLLFVERQRERGYWQIQNLEDLVEELRTHLH